MRNAKRRLARVESHLVGGDLTAPLLTVPEADRIAAFEAQEQE